MLAAVMAALFIQPWIPGYCYGVMADTHGDDERVQAYVQRGMHYFDLKDYKSAIKSWIRALQFDPLNEEVLDLIDEARFQSEYHVAVLDRLEKEKLLKTPYAHEISDIANQMMNLLSEAEDKVDAQRQKQMMALSKKDAEKAVAARQAYVREVFEQGLMYYRDRDYEKACAEWEEILPVLPEEDLLAKKIAKLKERIAEAQQIEKKATEQAQIPPLVPERLKEEPPKQRVKEEPADREAAVTKKPSTRETEEDAGEPKTPKADSGVVLSGFDAAMEEATSDQARRYLRRGQNYFVIEDYDNAIRTWGRAMEADTKNSHIQNLIRKAQGKLKSRFE